MKTNLSILTLVLLTAFASCRSDSVQPDKPVDKPEKPTDKPDKPNENKDSISVFKKTKISWADTDYQEVEYDATNTPIRYTRQNLYVQGTNQVRRVVCELIYAGNQLMRLNASNGSYVNYSYEADKVSRTEEFSPAGKLISTRVYHYFPDNRLRRIYETQGEATRAVETLRTFTYDTKGNLAQIVDAIKDAQTGTYRVGWVTRYSDYDSYKNVSNLWTIYPLLPNVTLQVNNPAAIATYVEGADGVEKLLQRTDYVFRYNEQGYPVSHTETRPGGSLTATYTYVGR